MDEDINAIMATLEEGIDVGKETVIGLHKMEENFHKISAITHLLMEEGEFVDFLFELGEKIGDLLNEIKLDEDGELHLVVEGEAAIRLGKAWILSHRARIKERILEENTHAKHIIGIIKKHFELINELFDENKEEFHEDPEIHALCQKLHKLFIFYLNLFAKELSKLS
jgi:hypothetical protein